MTSQAKNPSNSATPLAIGDVLALRASVDQGLLWVVSALGPEAEGAELVPFDPERLAGPGDLEIDAPSDVGAGTLRCRHLCSLPSVPAEARVCGRLPPSDIDRMGETLGQLAYGTLNLSPSQLETRELPEYTRREAEVRQALEALVDAPNGKRKTTPEVAKQGGRTTETSKSNTRPFDAGGWGSWAGLAALLIAGLGLLIVLAQSRFLHQARQAQRAGEAALAEERRLRRDRELEVAALEDRILRFEQGEEMAELSGLPVAWLTPRRVLRSPEASDSLEVSGRPPGWVLVFYVPERPRASEPVRLVVSQRADEAIVTELLARPMGTQQVSLVVPRERLSAGDYWIDLYQGDERLAEYALSIPETEDAP